jgi:ABC-type transport system involved in cytochrome c biogenesis permease component
VLLLSFLFAKKPMLVCILLCFRANSYADCQFTWFTIHFLVIFTLPTPLKNSLLNLLLFPIYFPLNAGAKSAVVFESTRFGQKQGSFSVWHQFFCKNPILNEFIFCL